DLARSGVDAGDGPAATGGDEQARSVGRHGEAHRLRAPSLDADAAAAAPGAGVDHVDGGALLGADEGALAVPREGPCARTGRHGGARQHLEGARIDDVDLVVLLAGDVDRSEEHTSELQSLAYLVCRLL